MQESIGVQVYLSSIDGSAYSQLDNSLISKCLPWETEVMTSSSASILFSFILFYFILFPYQNNIRVLEIIRQTKKP